MNINQSDQEIMDGHSAMTNNNVFKEIYYDPSHSAGYSSVQKLFDASKAVLPSITFYDTKNWLQSQITYTLHKPLRKRFARNPVVVENVDEQWQAELVNMQEFSRTNNGYKYILIAVDVLSKYGFAEPMKTKHSKSAVAALTKMFKHRIPVKFQTDRGTEFVNSDVKEFMRRNNV